MSINKRNLLKLIVWVMFWATIFGTGCALLGIDTATSFPAGLALGAICGMIAPWRVFTFGSDREENQ